MYLDFTDRGHRAAGTLGGSQPLAAAQTQTPVSISEVLDLFAPNVRTRLRTLLDQLGHGLQDRGRALRAVFVRFVPLVREAGRIADQLADRGPLVRRLVHNASVLTKVLGDRERQLRTLMTDGGSTLTALEASTPDLDATLRELPVAVDSVDTGFAALRGTLGDVDHAVRTLYPVAGHLPAALGALRRLSADAAPAIRALRPPVGQLVPLVRRLRPLSADLADATATLLPQVPAVNKTTRDLKLCKTGVQNFFQWNASMAKFGDTRGPIPRGNLVLGAQSSSVLNDPEERANPSCAPGRAIGGRPATAKDFH
jgi:ABC-type transporter Mla subunit MlaD